MTLFNDETTPDRAARDLEKLLMVPGDGTVTTESLLALDNSGGPDALPRSSRRFASTYFFCESHGFLPAHRGFQDNLFHVLFHSPTRPTTTAGVVGGR